MNNPLITMYTSEVFSIYEEAPNTKSYYIAKPKGFDYRPGQYIRLLFSAGNGVRYSRYFTLSSSPLDDFLRITVNIHESPFKQLLDQVKVPGFVNFYGPHGQFSLADDMQGEIVCLSMGIGITPFVSMYRYAYWKRLPVNMRLIAIFKTAQEFAFKYMFDQLEIGSLVRGHPLRSMFWSSQSNRFTFEKLQKKIPDWKKVSFFLCGSDQFVRGYRQKLREARIPASRIHHELFI